MLECNKIIDDFKLLNLEYISQKDHDFLNNIKNDCEYLKNTFDDTKNFINNNLKTYEKSKSLYFTIKRNKGKIGIIELKLRKITDFKASVFIYIENESRNLGIAKNLFYKIANLLFNKYGFKKIFIDIPAYSKNSIHFVEKLGFKPEVIKRSKVLWNNNYYDLILYGILKEEFQHE